MPTTRKSKPSRSTSFWQRRVQSYDPVVDTQKVYRCAVSILRLKQRWDTFCTEVLDCDPHDELLRLDISRIHPFFEWLLENTKIGYASTLQTHWNTFQMLYRQESGNVYFPLELKLQMSSVRARLAAQYGLETRKRDKGIARVEEQFEILRTLWESPNVKFEHERQRVQFALILHIAGLSGQRPESLVNIRYGDIAVELIRETNAPRDTPPRVIVKFTFTYSKTYLGLKDANQFTVPDIHTEHCLLLCPQITLLALLFADRAFDENVDLRDAESFFKLRVHAQANSLSLPIKEILHDAPIFSRIQRGPFGPTPSIRPESSDWLREKLRHIGRVAGFGPDVKPYDVRRGTGEALDSSSFISDSQRNQILQHRTSLVYQHNYLPRHIGQDTNAIYQGLQPQVQLMRTATGMTRTIDTRRPQHLTDQQLAEIENHEETQRLVSQRKALMKRIKEKHGTLANAEGTSLHAQHTEAVSACRKHKRLMRIEKLNTERQQFTRKQAVADIRQQLQASDAPASPTCDTQVAPALSNARQRAFSAVFEFATSTQQTSYVEEVKRRCEAINALAALCSVQEPAVKRAWVRKKVAVDNLPEASIELKLSMRCAPTQCIFCLGCEGLAVNLRQKEFVDRCRLKIHFHRKHLRHLPDSKMVCPHPLCVATLSGLQHLQNHAETVHGTPT